MLNYVAQGELWAAAGATRTETYAIAYTWKYTINGCVVVDGFSNWACSARVLSSFGDIQTMIDIGYDHYYQDPHPPAPWPYPEWP